MKISDQQDERLWRISRIVDDARETGAPLRMYAPSLSMGIVDVQQVIYIFGKTWVELFNDQSSLRNQQGHYHGLILKPRTDGHGSNFHNEWAVFVPHSEPYVAHWWLDGRAQRARPAVMLLEGGWHLDYTAALYDLRHKLRRKLLEHLEEAQRATARWNQKIATADELPQEPPDPALRIKP